MNNTTRKERRENANLFYNIFMDNKKAKACIIVLKEGIRTQFLTLPSLMSDNALVIAESRARGLNGCWEEFFDSIGILNPKTMEDTDFTDWLRENANLAISYNDNLAIMLERAGDKETIKNET